MTTLYMPRNAFSWPPFIGHNALTNLGLVVHFDGYDQHLVGLGHPACIQYWQDVRTWHIEKNWSDIGYSYGACPHGYIFEGRGYGKEQAAQRTDKGGIPNGNTRYCSVTLMSGPGEEVTEKQLEAVRWLRNKLMREHGMSGDVFGHKDFSKTDCPGSVAYKLVRSHAFSGPMSTGRPTLKLVEPYMRGEAVREAQKLLGMAEKERDGVYGPDTAAYVRAFKRVHGLDDNTVLGFRAWKLLLELAG